MPTRVVVGSQWGDEGKAKIVDFLTKDADIVVRFQGGANAGHTVKVDGQEFIFHLIPAGMMHPGKIGVIGNGVVIDPAALLKEIDDLERQGINIEGRLFISQNAHVVMPYHKLLDQADESNKGREKIGTTGKGIGPCYRDKIARRGIRVVDLIDRKSFREKLMANIREYNEILIKLYGYQKLDEEQIIEEYIAFDQRIDPFVRDTSIFLNEAIDAGSHVLFEGAQGTLLDIDHGTYPFVTSSTTTSGGACSGTGVGPTKIDEVIGVTKAFTTRVGNGPFPTELTGEMGNRLRDLGHEYGATTGRPRRTGWFDVVIVRLSARINGFSSLAITRLDILDSLPTLRICTAYRCQDRILENFPSDPRILDQCEPIYEECEGWGAPTVGVRRFEDLPMNAQRYLNRISELTRTPVSLISVGADREETIVVEGTCIA
ncbi:MAG: adenylosuccinate synthase [Candidatus Latescibacteria bacterium]|nr:adenylosuccinate synthase [Candidatus Latescibacterota bacterium]